MPTPYIQIAGHLSRAIIDDFKIVSDFWEKLPDATAAQPATRRDLYNPGSEKKPQYLWSCHGLCRGVKPFLNQQWHVIDGWFLRRGNEHCWLWTKDDRHDAIIDVYPVGACGGPILVDGSPLTPWSDAYIERFMNYSDAERSRFDAEGAEAASLYKEMIKTASE